jgi:thioredoxin 1
MEKSTKIAIVVVLMVCLAAIVGIKQMQKRPVRSVDAAPPGQSRKGEEERSVEGRLLDIGAGKCTACKRMMPVLEELRKEYAGVLGVEYIDLEKNPDATDHYEIRLIPTQIFFDGAGKELFRHEGFIGKDDIVAKFRELGVPLEGKPEGS